jgi:hypothetical protein
VIPDSTAARVTRKRRVAAPVDAGPQGTESRTMGPEAVLGLVPDVGQPVVRRPGTTPTPGRTDSAAG